MTAKFIQNGESLEYTNAGTAISSGDVVVLSPGATGSVGVAMTDIAATTGVGTVAMEGVFELTKAASQDWIQGEKAFATSAGVMTTVATANTPAGLAWNTVDNGAGSVLGYVKLNAGAAAT